MRCDTFFYIRACAMSLLLTACVSGDPLDTPQPEPQRVDMPISITIPANDALTRAPGDPGLSTGLMLPKHVYLYLIYNLSLDGSGPDYVEPHSYLLTPENWVKETYSGSLKAENDEVWRYTGNLSISIPDTRSNGRVYAAASYAPLTVSNDSPATEQEVKDLTFDVSTPDLQQHLGDLYSTPYNYLGTRTQYYGTIANFSSKVPSVDLMLYHVAAKVDVIWNVAADVQSDNRITQVAAIGLKQLSCYLFRPTENLWTADDDATHYDSPFATDPGTQWLGRHPFYVIPWQYPAGHEGGEGKMDVSVRFRKNNHHTAEYGYTVTYRNDLATQKVQHTDMQVFVPWLRGQVNFSTDIPDTGTYGPVEVE